MIDPLLEAFPYAKHHGGGGTQAQLVSRAMHRNPILGRAFQPCNAMPYFVVEDLGAAAGNGSQPCIPQPRNGIAHGEIAVFRDGENFRCGETMQPYLGKALLDAPEETFEPFDLEIRVQAALHQNASATHLHDFGDFLVNRFEIENVTFAGQLTFKRSIKSTKAAILGAKICIVDVAVNDVGNYAFGMQLAPKRIGLNTQADEVIGAKIVESLSPGNGHIRILRVWRPTIQCYCSRGAVPTYGCENCLCKLVAPYHNQLRLPCRFLRHVRTNVLP